ncbi:MAG: hypothetical protein K6C38_08355 [Saccharofermentans sp.]|nr:hypothetical protein [Saccharofermentans sp.]
MKILRNILTIAALILALLITGCSFPIPETTFVTVASIDGQQVGQPNATAASSDGAETTETTDLYMATESLDFSDFIFVGDSRTVGMGQVLNLNTIAEVGVGYSFLAAHREEILEYSGKNIVFNLGVNDLAHIDDYIEFFQRLPEEFCFDNNIYVVSVNPTSGAYSSMNGDIDYFNVQLSDSLPSTCKWIDTCSFLREAGFGSPDGLHYDQQTYELIANLIYNNVMLYQSLGY